MLKAIIEMYEENSFNCVALIIIDYKMRKINGIELIEKTREYLKSKGVEPYEMPVFAFRATQFWDLGP